VMLKSEPHFPPSIQAVGDAVIGVKSGLVSAAELRQVIEYLVGVDAVSQKDPLIGECPLLEKRLRPFFRHKIKKARQDRDDPIGLPVRSVPLILSICSARLPSRYSLRKPSPCCGCGNVIRLSVLAASH